MIYHLIRIAMILSMGTSIFASSDLSETIFNIDLRAYIIRKDQPRDGAIYDPVNTEDPIVWLFNPLHRVKLFKDKNLLFIQRVEGYADRKILMYLSIRKEKNVQLVVQDDIERIISDILSKEDLDVIMRYVSECLKITLQRYEENV